MFNFFKNKKKAKAIEIVKQEKSKELKERFLEYKKLVENNRMGYNKIMIVNYLISVIVEHMNFLEAIQSFEKRQKIQNNSLIEEIYRKLESEVLQTHNSIIIDKIHEDDKKYFKGIGRELMDGEPLNIHINKLPILLNPWNGERVIDNLVEINEENIFDGKAYSYNIQNHYLYPMNIIVCNGGNHSQFAVKIKNQGYTIIKELHNYSNIYNLVEFNGENYVKSIDQTIIELNYDENILFYSGIIFEMGRYILENKYHSLSLTKEKFN